MPSRYCILGLLYFFLFTLVGCSIHYTDKKGVNHQLGFVHAKSWKNDCLLTSSVSTIGINLDASNHTSGLNIGYKNQQNIYIIDGLIELDENKNILTIKKFHSNVSKENCYKLKK